MNRTCIECRVEKPLLTAFVKHVASRGGRRVVCKECLKKRKDPEKQRLRDREYGKTVQGKYIRWGKNLRKGYGITQEDWARMFNAQDGRCGVCLRAMDVNSTDRDIHLDHNHETGANRELLCKFCNSMIGMCGEDEGVLQRAIDYLRRHR